MQATVQRDPTVLVVSFMASVLMLMRLRFEFLDPAPENDITLHVKDDETGETETFYVSSKRIRRTCRGLYNLRTFHLMGRTSGSADKV